MLAYPPSVYSSVYNPANFVSNVETQIDKLQTQATELQTQVTELQISPPITSLIKYARAHARIRRNAGGTYIMISPRVGFALFPGETNVQSGRVKNPAMGVIQLLIPLGNGVTEENDFPFFVSTSSCYSDSPAGALTTIVNFYKSSKLMDGGVCVGLTINLSISNVSGQRLDLFPDTTTGGSIDVCVAW